MGFAKMSWNHTGILNKSCVLVLVALFFSYTSWRPCTVDTGGKTTFDTIISN